MVLVMVNRKVKTLQRANLTLAAHEHALVELAVVTTAANHHPILITNDDGSTVRRFVRDSAPVPRRRAVRVYKALPPRAAEASSDRFVSVQAQPDSNLKRAGPRDCAECQATKRRRTARDHVALLEGWSLAHWRHERSKRSFQAVSSTPATERIAAVRSRIASV